MLFGKKRKKEFFGKNIEASCKICRYSFEKDSELSCSFGNSTEITCKSYSYDPLKRIPENTPNLGSYTKEDFSL